MAVRFVSWRPVLVLQHQYEASIPSCVGLEHRLEVSLACEPELCVMAVVGEGRYEGRGHEAHDDTAERG